MLCFNRFVFCKPAIEKRAIGKIQKAMLLDGYR